MKKVTIVVMFITIISKVLGFVRDVSLARVFGIGAVSDAFNLATTIPNSVLSVIGAALVTGIIPMLTRLSGESDEKVNRFTSNVMSIMISFCAIIMLAMFLVPEFVVGLFASGLNDEAIMYASAFLRVISFGVFSIAIVQLGSGFLNVKKNFLIPAFITIPSNVVVITAIFLASKLNNPLILGYGQLGGLILQSVIVFIYMYRSGFKYHFIIDLKDQDLRMMVTLALPLLLSSFLGQFNDIVMKNYATNIHTGGTGGYSYMTYATKLIGFVSGIFITAILNVTYPTIAHNVVSGDNKKLNKSINDAILMISLFVIPAIVGFITFARPIVEFVYLQGKITPADIDIIVPIFIFDSLVLMAMALRELMYRIHYAYHDMKTPVKNTILVSVVFIISMFVFSNLFGRFGHPLAGLSFAYSLAAIIACFPIIRSAKRLIGKTYFKFILKDLIKIVVSAAIMGATILLLKGPVMGFISGRIGTIIVIGLGVIAYFIALIALRTNFALSLISSFLFRDKK